MMAGNLLDRLGQLFGRHAQAPAAAPAEAPPAEAAPPTAAEPAVVEAPPAEAAPAEATAPAPDSSAPVVAEAAPSAPTKSPEELEEERLWAEVDQAWGAGDFHRVTGLLEALKALEPGDATAIDEKIAAAQYNEATRIEAAGDLQRALYLYQEAQRHNPNLGEAGFAIERVQGLLQPAASAPASQPAAPAERTYTVEAGDNLSSIAERFYGSPDWQRIFDANRDQLDNPDLIQPGQTLRIP
jgi:hypothetical protein